ncbi:MAG: pyridoxamine 5'-phosphate oxidase family protein [Magnetospirillum sp.]|nr:pyridoxamine 5'-phosphate oxidase family protein [Magnetospirillum sp.]
MAQHFSALSNQHMDFIRAQPIFFVATALDDGRINLSPKGLDGTFTIRGPNRVAWLNLTGSGNETAAHLRRNDRITLMFCAFSGAPLILRAYGHARALHRRDAQWKEHERLFPDFPGKRQIVVVEIDSVITSCGFGVPLMTLEGQRPNLPQWATAKGPEGIEQYWRDRNLISFDGLETGIVDEADSPS